MVTRNIKANTATQVNANLIGVQVRPGNTEGEGTGSVDCKLSYSVDGSTWTDWPENMTDDNNVISNIPRYMYLKFSQDVIITEE